MTTLGIREQLYDYIRIANDKKIKAIYMMLEDEIVKEVKWWKDEVFTEELEKRYAAWQNRKEKSYTLKEIETTLELEKKRRKAK